MPARAPQDCLGRKLAAPLNYRMPLAEKQQHLVARYAVIEDRHERLAAVIARGARWSEVADEERTDARRVWGCASAVWLASTLENGRCHFRISAASALVKGLAALLAELYDGETPAAILAWEPGVLAGLGLASQLSPTRLHGLAQIRRAMRDFAAAAPP
jgi:cysteine desulfuration protein SufE